MRLIRFEDDGGDGVAKGGKFWRKLSGAERGRRVGFPDVFSSARNWKVESLETREGLLEAVGERPTFPSTSPPAKRIFQSVLTHPEVRDGEPRRGWPGWSVGQPRRLAIAVNIDRFVALQASYSGQVYHLSLYWG